MELLNTISNNRIWVRHGPLILKVAAALFLCLILASVTWDVYRQQQVRALNYAPQNIPPIQTKRDAGYQVNNIVKANLFGKIPPKKVERPVVKTTLNLKLQGILWDSREGMARAIITSGKKPAELYAVGQEIKGAGASIKEIRGTEVLLNRNGATESLPLNIKTAEELAPFVGSLANYEPAGTAQQAGQFQSPTNQRTQKQRARPRSANGEPSKVRRPNFSGLDKALRKMGEI
ncbi:type II secretion system protein N [Arenicella xantha]|uniref:Type II secretion system (T2SS) protein C n=1 Tax=Arenicella xantha TaxID=644221 RepID=A0A395JNJ6_9GAMM|nr:type II secretion system protein N [Arenicella xantha]RBP49644.1 type II secretion system (T2SS) protein C [Arenicella xantha]